MNPLLFFGGAFLVAIAIAAVITRFQSSGPRAPAEEKRLREKARQAAESNRKRMQWLAAGVLCVLAVLGVSSWLISDPMLSKAGLSFTGTLALAFVVLWAKTRDDGLNPQLRKEKPSQPSEPPEPPR